MQPLSWFWRSILDAYYHRFHRLQVEELSPDRASGIAGFYCGDSEWERPLSDWITGPGVVEDMKDPKRQTKVWLYWLGKKLVGYGSLGTSRRPYPVGSKSYTNLTIIPFIAVQKIYQGKPRKAKTADRYAGQIMYDLIARAVNMPNDLLVLYVHPSNHRAKRFYKKIGFDSGGICRNEHEIMAKRLK